MKPIKRFIMDYESDWMFCFFVFILFEYLLPRCGIWAAAKEAKCISNLVAWNNNNQNK